MVYLDSRMVVKVLEDTRMIVGVWWRDTQTILGVWGDSQMVAAPEVCGAWRTILPCASGRTDQVGRMLRTRICKKLFFI